MEMDIRVGMEGQGERGRDMERKWGRGARRREREREWGQDGGTKLSG